MTVSERVYLVGLPVGITVSDDGTITYEVDISEAGEAIREGYPDPVLDDQPTEEQVLLDAAAVEQDNDVRARHGKFVRVRSSR